MKKLIIVNLLCSILMITSWWMAGLSLSGAWIHPVLMAAPGVSLLIFSFSFCVFLVLFIIGATSIKSLWLKYKLTLFLPLILLLLGPIGVVLRPNCRNIAMKRFEKYLPEYNSFVNELKKSHTTGEYDYVNLIREKNNHLGYYASAYDNEPNNFYVVICVGYGGVFKHVSYLYTSSGEITKETRAYEGYPNRRRINENWFRVSD